MTPPVLELDVPSQTATARPSDALLDRLRRMAHVSLPRMYSPAAGRYVFTVRREGAGMMPEGLSDRYTAIALIGLAADGLDRWTLPFDPIRIAGTLVDRLSDCENLGDAALITWAAGAVGVDTAAPWEQVARLFGQRAAHPTVETSWALAASVIDSRHAAPTLQKSLLASVLLAWNPQSGMFGHTAGGGSARSHVACFADQVYPIFALSRFAAKYGDPAALDAAAGCARRICALQGAAGQWWWHYDHRTGDIVEGYPVYAIHQDAMGPMALRALKDAGGGEFDEAIRKGLRWLDASPELHGGSLIDDDAQMLWRKVARREPMKATRYLQAACTKLHPRFRAPGVDVIFPASVIDYEDRPYHWGWFLYAWAARQDSHP